MRSLHEMRPIGSLNLYCHLRRIRTAELCVIAASILTAGTDMNVSNSLLTHCDAAQARVQRKLNKPKRGADDKRLQGSGEGSVANVIMLREHKDEDGQGNEAHIKILPVILNVGHGLGRDNKTRRAASIASLRTCALPSLVMVSLRYMRSGVNNNG